MGITNSPGKKVLWVEFSMNKVSSKTEKNKGVEVLT